MANVQRVDDLNFDIDNYIIRIKVLDNNNNPISGAIINCRQIDQEIPETNNSGITYIPINDDFDSLHISVNATGYFSKLVFIPKGDNGKFVSLTTVKLDPTTNTYYYTICVRDSVDYNQKITDATIEITDGSSNTIGKTNSSGIYLYQTNSLGSVYVKVSKNGYETKDSILLTHRASSINDSASSPDYINLVKSQSSNYYCNLLIKDNNGLPVKGVNVRIFTNFALSNPWYGSGVTVRLSQEEGKDELFALVQLVLSAVSSYDISNIKKEDKLIVHIEDNAKLSKVITDINNTFNLSITLSEIIQHPNDTVDWLVELIRTKIANLNIPLQRRVKTVFKTGEDGKIKLYLGSYTSKPSNLYAKCMSIDSPSYTWESIGPKVCLTSTTDENECETIFVRSLANDKIYYYNYRFIDSLTGFPISGVSVQYSSNGEVLKNTISDNDGYVSYSCNISKLNINISKAVYDSYSTITEGNDDSSVVKNTLLEPNYSIQVIYDDSFPEEYAYKPISDLDVEIFYKDNSGKEISKGIYTTNSYGYIETLNENVYISNGKYFAVVTNYYLNNKDKLRKTIYSTHNRIELPPLDNEYDSDYIPEENEFDEFNEVSVNSIKTHLAIGNQELSSTSNHLTNMVSYNGGTDYRINIIDPDTINVYDIFEGTPVMVNDNKKDIIGSFNINLKNNINDLRVKMINRYSGYYNPIFKDVLFYNNFKSRKNENESNEDVDELLYSNTSFDYDYNDNYGKFGVIKNLWFHKANDENKEIFTALTPYYPLTGQYALDYRDYNVFETNWDKGHYTKQIDIDNSDICLNMSSMKEGLCMFGSKYLNVPERVEIYGFTLGDDSEWKGEWNDNWITQPEGCPGEIMFKEINSNSTDFYLFMKKRIIRFFCDKLRDEFRKYIAETFSFGRDGVEDDMEEYINKNVLKLYKLDKVRVFIRRTKMGQHNSKIDNDYTKYLEFDKTCTEQADKDYFDEGKHNLVEYFKQHGFEEITNVTLTKINRDNFDRKLVYNLKPGYKEEFGFSFLLKKI